MDVRLDELETLHALFEDFSIEARLRQHLGQSTWDTKEKFDLKPMAKELLSSPEIIEKEWDWLTSGEAVDSWRFGIALAEMDKEQTLVAMLPSLYSEGRRDFRILCGYIATYRKEFGDEWYDKWFEVQLQRDPKPLELIFQVGWRCGATVQVALHIAELFVSEDVDPKFIGVLGFASWGEELPPEILEKVLRAMNASGNAATAITILDYRMGDNESEDQFWKPLALELATTPELIRSDSMTNYHWKQVTSRILNESAELIATSIFREQANREVDSWFAEYSDAKEILKACAEEDAVAVWKAMLPFVESYDDVHRFRIGFPEGVIALLPVDEILVWIKDEPVERGAIVAQLNKPDFTNDETLACRVLGEYGDVQEVDCGFYGSYTTGSWSGPTSEHWEDLASVLDSAIERTSLPKFKRWAADVATDLRKRAIADRQREEEERLHWR